MILIQMIKNLNNYDLKKRLLQINDLELKEKEYKIKKYLKGFIFYEFNFSKIDIQSALLGYYFIINFQKIMNEKLFFDEYKKTDIILFKHFYNVKEKLLKDSIVFNNFIEIDTTRLIKVLIMIYYILPDLESEVLETKYIDFNSAQKIYISIYSYVKFYEINLHSIIESNKINAESFLKILSIANNINNKLTKFEVNKLIKDYYII